MSDDEMCFWHGNESSQPGDFHWCHECGHVWRTAEDFRADVERTVRQVFEGDPEAIATVLARPLSENYHCPLCAHDFFMPVAASPTEPPTPREAE